jgi:hypothetical protein
LFGTTTTTTTRNKKGVIERYLIHFAREQLSTKVLNLFFHAKTKSITSRSLSNMCAVAEKKALQTYLLVPKVRVLCFLDCFFFFFFFFF